MDKKMLMAFYIYAQKNKAFGGLVNAVYKYSSAVFFLIYTGGGAYLFLTDKAALVLYIMIPSVQLAFVYALRKAVKRKRPYLVLKLIPPKNKAKKLASGTDSYSFPSNHASSAGIISFACMYINPRLGCAVFFLAVITGMSRLFTAVHYPTDVFAGIVISAVFAVLGFSVLPHYLSLLPL